jgi:lipoate-protein ligase A
MNLHLLPDRTGSAAENMALDFLLLQRYPQAAARFRHYGWRRPAFTFGYSQKIAFVRSQVVALTGGAEDSASGRAFDLCRRPTGGGLVDHREDWTYALVIPRGHPLEEVPAPQSYRAVHEGLAAALRRQSVAAVAKAKMEPPVEGQSNAGPGVCFQRAELYDVVNPATGEKIAGAAQKRNKHGLLFQGSVWRPAAGTAVDWDRFREDFIAELALTLAIEAVAVPWPELAEHEIEGLTEQYGTPEWNESR